MRTSKERREVAARLRDAAELPEENILAALVDICGINFNFGGNVTIWRSTMTRLADLIDPTCEVSSVETYCNELGQLEGWDFQLTCGHSFQRPWNESPAYCPDCGARVVNSDDQ